MADSNVPEPGESRLLNPRRSAHATIRGYLYQTCLGVLRWLDLKPNEILLCEGDEDLDRFLLGGGAVSEQVKAYTGGLSLSDRAVVESLGNFLRSYVALRRRGEDRSFVFTTTAHEKKKRIGGVNFDLLEAWKAGNRTPEVLAVVQSLLKPGEDDKNREKTTEAIAWLDTESEGWKGFMDAVEWSFEAPDLDAIRTQIKNRLATGDDTSSLPAETFLERLVAHVLRTSSQPKPENRVLNSKAFSDFIEAARTDLGNWMRTPAAGRLRIVFDEIKQIHRLLHDNTAKLPEKASPGKLLTAAYEVIPFDEVGRREELESLTRWCDSDDHRRSVLLLTGEGGSGKTRLMIEWCRHLRHLGWHAGFLGRDSKAEDMPPLLEGVAPRFIVIDYAETRLGVVEPLLLKLGLQAQDEGPKLRLILLARRQADWWKNLLYAGREVEDLLLNSPEPWTITPLVPKSIGDREKALRAAAEGFSIQLSLKVPQDLHIPDLSRDEFERVLYLHMAALATLRGERLETAESVLMQTLYHERLFWRNWVSGLGLDRSSTSLISQAVDLAATAVTLTGGTRTLLHAQSLLARALKDLSLQPNQTTTLLDLLRGIYGGMEGEGGFYIDPVQPDLLGEELVAEVLNRDESFLARILDDCSVAEGYSVLTLLTRLAQNRPHLEYLIGIALHGRLEHLSEAALHIAIETGDPIGVELAKQVEQYDTIDLCTRLLSLCEPAAMRQSVPLRELVLVVTKRVLDSCQSSWQEPTQEQEAELGRLANNLSTILIDMERNEEALAFCEEAIRLRRKAANQSHDPKHLNYLASSLINLGHLLSTMRQYEKALQATTEAVAIYRTLARGRERTALAALALGVNNLATNLANLGRLEAALQANREALDIYHSIGNLLSPDYQMALVRCLRNRGNYLSELGRRDEALDAAMQAVVVCRQFATQRPDIFLPDLSSTLNNLGNRFGNMGYNEQAAEVLKESAAILRELAIRRPSQYLPTLGVRLSNLSICLNEMQCSEEALIASKEAVDIFRHLALQSPLEFQHKLAGSLINLGVSYDNSGGQQKALEAYYESVAIHRQLAAKRPTNFLQPLALSLGNLGNLLRKLGKPAESLGMLDEAVSLGRQVAKTEIDFSPHLVTSIYNLSLVLRDLGDLESAFRAVTEAHELLRPLYKHFPNAFQKQMTIVTNFYNRLAEALGKGPAAR
jgi:tetratricopeptide (TPR) repeat protein